MNKKLKITLAVAINLVVIGVLVFVIAMSVLGWDFTKLDSTEYTAKNYAVGDNVEVKRVELDVDTFPIDIVRGDAVTLDYYEASNSEVTVACENGVLKVREKYNWSPFETGMFNIGRSSRKYKLTLTDGIDVVNVKGVNGDLRLDGMTFAELNFNSTNGDLRLVDCTVETLTVDCTNATVSLKNSELGTVTVDGLNADAEMIGCTGGSVSIDSTNLDVAVMGSSFGDVAIDGTNSDVVVTDAVIDNLTIDGTNGGYILKNITVNALTLRATNLDARIEIAGRTTDYTVNTHGRDLPANRVGVTDKLIELSGTNNDVVLLFSEN